MPQENPQDSSTEEREELIAKIEAMKINGIVFGSLLGREEIREALTDFILADRQATAKASEEAVIEKIRPLLVDEEFTPAEADGGQEDIAINMNYYCKASRNFVRTQLRTALGIEGGSNSKEHPAVAETRRVREWNEAYYKRHGHEWYEDCNQYCSATQGKDK